jgi:hypothetical protein
MLLAPHFLDRLYPRGTLVGTGTDIPFAGTPSNQMAGLDAAGKAAVDKLHQALYGKPPPWGDIAATLETDLRRAAEEARSDPVSYQQARERGAKEYKGVPTESPLPPHSLSLTPPSGDPTHTFGEIVGAIVNAPARI